MEYLIETIEDPLFVRNSPEIRRIIVLLGLNTYKNVPLNELVVSSDTIVKQKIQRLEDELTTFRFAAVMILRSVIYLLFIQPVDVLDKVASFDIVGGEPHVHVF